MTTPEAASTEPHTPRRRLTPPTVAIALITAIRRCGNVTTKGAEVYARFDVPCTAVASDGSRADFFILPVGVGQRANPTNLANELKHWRQIGSVSYDGVTFATVYERVIRTAVTTPGRTSVKTAAAARP